LGKIYKSDGIKLDLLGANLASSFSVSDACGLGKSKDRTLIIEELTLFFKRHETKTTVLSAAII